MEIAPVLRHSVSDEVFAALVEEILSGRVAAEEALPAERDLAEAFGVNRHAVREALKRVQQAGLVRIAQGGKTRARDWRTHAGLDLLHALATSGAVPASDLVRDILVMRAAVGADAARLCAEAASDAEIRAVTAAARAYPAGPAGIGELVDTDLAFWSAVLDGAHNVAYRLGLNTLVSGIAGIGVEHVPGLLDEYADRAAHLELSGRIADRDGEAAHAVARRLLGPAGES